MNSDGVLDTIINRLKRIHRNDQRFYVSYWKREMGFHDDWNDIRVSSKGLETTYEPLIEGEEGEREETKRRIGRGRRKERRTKGRRTKEKKGGRMRKRMGEKENRRKEGVRVEERKGEENNNNK